MRKYIAEAYYGIPSEIQKSALQYLDDEQTAIVHAFESKYGNAEDKEFRPKAFARPAFGYA